MKKGGERLIYIKKDQMFKLQGDLSDTDFAKKLGISRTHLWRVRTGNSKVGAKFLSKFKAAFPDKSIEDYFFTD